ncbi:kinase-like domain-containing protein [Gautieria morchelliformis]|nr:kinase-like domain-containing protein [Gautieria morchelliformis]
MVLNQVSYKLEHRLGIGARALVAVKKSRVSLRAQVILSLPHHPGIPAIYAYGRLPHFEYLAMELLGPTLGDIQAQPLWLLALQHIHSHGLIHVDVKPGNILLVEPDRQQLRLADFGLARLIDSTKPTPGYLGTLNYTSLNSHQGLALSQRDDLESLAYTIFAFLRSKLPWTKWDFVRNMLNRSHELQVFEKKKRWPGSRLAEGFDPVYGQFLEYVRKLKHLSAPDYNRWIMIFTTLCRQGEWLAFDYKASIGSEKDEPRSKRERLPFTVEVGQLCYIRILPTLTLEGYTGRRKDPSFYDDPSFSEELWNTRSRPAVILDTRYLGNTRYIRALPISLCYPSSSLLKWRLVPSKSLREEEELMASGGNWPPIQEDIWCFCMHGMTTFRPDPNEVCLCLQRQCAVRGITFERLESFQRTGKS